MQRKATYDSDFDYNNLDALYPESQRVEDLIQDRQGSKGRFEGKTLPCRSGNVQCTWEDLERVIKGIQDENAAHNRPKYPGIEVTVQSGTGQVPCTTNNVPTP